jgi:hypothetical protein
VLVLALCIGWGCAPSTPVDVGDPEGFDPLAFGAPLQHVKSLVDPDAAVGRVAASIGIALDVEFVVPSSALSISSTRNAPSPAPARAGETVPWHALLGKTFVLDPATMRYLSSAERNDAPADGLAVVLYAATVGAGLDPYHEVGLIAVGGLGAGIAEINDTTSGQTYLSRGPWQVDITYLGARIASYSEVQNVDNVGGSRLLQDGVLSVDGDSLSLTLERLLSGTSLLRPTVYSLALRDPGDGFGIKAIETQVDAMGLSESVTLPLPLQATAGRDTLILGGVWDRDTVDFWVKVNAGETRRVAGTETGALTVRSANGAGSAAPAGAVFSQDQLEVLRGILEFGVEEGVALPQPLWDVSSLVGRILGLSTSVGDGSTP